MALDRNRVPCGDCHLCCRMMTVLRPDKGDDPSQYNTALWFRDGVGKPPVVVLDREPNGDCAYLGPHGCTIHDRAPFECRDFDCRNIFRNSDRNGRRHAIKNNVMPKAIFDRGRELVSKR